MSDYPLTVEIPATFEEAMAYFDDRIIYEPVAKRSRYLNAVLQKFDLAALRQQSPKEIK